MSKPHQNIKPSSSKSKNDSKQIQPNKLTNNSTNNTKTITNKSNLKQLLLSSSHFSQLQKNSNINYSMYQGPKKAKPQNKKQDQKVASVKASKSKETKRYINTSENKAPRTKNHQKDIKEKYEKYETMKFNQIKSNRTVNPESFEHTQEKDKSSLLCTPKPEKAFQEPQSNIYSSVQKVQFDRIENLKRYLHQDTERLAKTKKLSDAHIIQQMSLTQHNLNLSLQESLAQTRTLQIQHYKQIQQVREKYEVMIQENRKEIEGLVSQLKEQRTARVKSDILLKQSEVKMRCIKEKLEQKETLCKKLTQALDNEKRVKQSIQAQLETTIQEKKSIRKQVQEVLYAVREEIRQKAAEINKSSSH